MRFGWRKPYESRGSRTVLRGARVKLPGLLTFLEVGIRINLNVQFVDRSRVVYVLYG